MCKDRKEKNNKLLFSSFFLYSSMFINNASECVVSQSAEIENELYAVATWYVLIFVFIFLNENKIK